MKNFFGIFRFNFFFEKTILDRIHKAVNEKINQSNFFRRQLFHLTYKIKVKRLEAGLDSPILNK
jgi:long-subunit acyl-CoA synthetase (AMP-forming)